MITSTNIIPCFLPVLNNQRYIFISRLFDGLESNNYFTEYPNFSIEFSEYLSIDFPETDYLLLLNKIFYSNNSNAYGKIQEVEVINEELIIKVLYNNINSFSLGEVVSEVIDGISQENSNISILKKYPLKPISLYYKKYKLNNLYKNKLNGNYTYQQINNISRFNRKDFIFIEKNPITQKKDFYFYQKPNL